MICIFSSLIYSSSSSSLSYPSHSIHSWLPLLILQSLLVVKVSIFYSLHVSFPYWMLSHGSCFSSRRTNCCVIFKSFTIRKGVSSFVLSSIHSYPISHRPWIRLTTSSSFFKSTRMKRESPPMRDYDETTCKLKLVKYTPHMLEWMLYWMWVEETLLTETLPFHIIDW